MGAFEDLINRANGSSNPEKKKKTFDELIDQGSSERMQEEVSNVDSDYINSFLDSSNRFFESAGEDYDRIGWDNASQLYRKNQTTLDDLNHRREVIGKWMEQNSDALDPETYKNLTVLTDFTRNTDSVMGTFTEARDFYDRDKNADAYLAYVDHQNKMSYDLEAGQKKIDDLNRAISLKKDIEAIGHDVPTDITGEYEALLQTYGWSEDDDLKDLLTQETVMFNRSKWAQKEAEMASVVNNPDFEKYSEVGVNVENPGGTDLR